MTHTPEPWHVDAYGCHNDYKLRLCEPMRSGFPLATIAQFQYNWRDAGQYDRQISYKEAEANVRRAAACVNALQGFSTEAIEAGGVQELVEAAREARECLRLGAVVPLRDTANYDEVSALGNRIGFGALMSTASLAWRDECGEMAGGEFVCCPCRSTSEKAMVKLDTGLSNGEASE